MSVMTTPARNAVKEALSSLTGNGRKITKEPVFSIEDVTTTKATKWLETNDRNRPLRRRLVTRYATDMRNGRWRLNGETIKLDTDGRLLDGQHRLRAILESGCTTRMAVVRNVDPASFATMDQGVKRAGYDHLALLGYKNAHALSVAAGHLRRYLRGDIGARDPVGGFVSGPEIVDTVEEFPELQDSVTAAHRCAICGPIGVFAFLHFAFSRKDAALADWFIGALGSGEGLSASDPVYRLRERLLRREVNTHMHGTRIMAICITAWNKTRAGERVVRLLAPDFIPEIE